MKNIEYKHEVYRKLIHLSSLWMPAFIYFADQSMALLVFCVGALGVFTYEILRRQKHSFAKLLNKLFGSILRPEEKRHAHFKPSGAVYVFIAAFLCTFFFSKEIAVTAMSMMLIGDAAAALIGRRCGRIKFWDKSLEGAIAFFVTSVVTALLIMQLVETEPTYLYAAIAAALAATIAELISKKIFIDDNLLIPLVAGSVMFLF